MVVEQAPPRGRLEEKGAFVGPPSIIYRRGLRTNNPSTVRERRHLIGAALAQRQSVSFVSLRSRVQIAQVAGHFFANMFFSHHKHAGVLFLSMDVMTNIFTVYLCKTKTNAIETMSLG